MSRSTPAWFLSMMIVLYSLAGASQSLLAEQKDDSNRLTIEKLGETKNVHGFGKHLLCGQPSAKEFAEAKTRGIHTVITFRQESETEWDEAEVVKNLEMEFHRFAFGAPDTLTDEIFDKSLKVLSDAKDEPFMLHCGSGNRVGAIWLAHRVLHDGLEIEEARKEAKKVGLRTPGYEEKALQYIKKASAP